MNVTAHLTMVIKMNSSLQNWRKIFSSRGSRQARAVTEWKFRIHVAHKWAMRHQIVDRNLSKSSSTFALWSCKMEKGVSRAPPDKLTNSVPRGSKWSKADYPAIIGQTRRESSETTGPTKTAIR